MKTIAQSKVVTAITAAAEAEAAAKHAGGLAIADAVALAIAAGPEAIAAETEAVKALQAAHAKVRGSVYTYCSNALRILKDGGETKRPKSKANKSKGELVGIGAWYDAVRAKDADGKDKGKGKDKGGKMAPKAEAPKGNPLKGETAGQIVAWLAEAGTAKEVSTLLNALLK